MANEMTPDEWQGYCHSLARLRHGEPNYQEVPDHDQGDLGIESFALDGSACVYQFYVAEAPDTAGRFSAQRRKLTTDLGKLKKYDGKLQKMLGFPIKRWILVVPNYDSKRIVEHATAKSREVCKQGLGCVDSNDFRVLVQDESAFEVERAALQKAGVAKALVAPADVAAEEVQVWSVDNASEVATLDGKLKALIRQHHHADTDQASLRQELLRYHLKGQNYAKQLADDYPDLYEKFARAKAVEEGDLVVRSLTTPAGANDHLESVRRQYESRLESAVPGLAPEDAPMLSWAGVAEWLIRCPLSFPESKS